MMQLVENNDTILINPCRNFDFTNPPFNTIEFSQEFIKYLYDRNGIGISANQVGIPYRIIGLRGEPENFVCFNPRIIDKSTEHIILEESCISFPNLIVKIKRPKIIKVRFQLPNSETVTKKFTGMTARIFQHQLDYLDGILYYNRANKYHRDKAFRKVRI